MTSSLISGKRNCRRAIDAHMGLLDFDEEYTVPFSPKRGTLNRWREGKENFEELQNFGRDRVMEDFSDSPHADRKPLPEDGNMNV